MDGWKRVSMNERKKKKQAGSITGVELGQAEKAGENEGKEEKY